MDIIVSPRGIVDIGRPGQGVRDMAQAGFDKVVLDFAMFCSEYELESAGKRKRKKTPEKHLPIHEDPKGLYDRARPMFDRCAQEGMRLPVAHAPYLGRDTRREDLSELLIRLTEECIRVCGKAGCTSIVVRPLLSGIPAGEEWEANRKYYLHFLKLAKENQVTVLLENQCRNRNGHLVRGVCSDGREAVEWVDRLNGEAGEERFGFCMDTGVCSLCGQDMREFAAALGNRIKAVVLRDCDGHFETSMLPFACANRGQSATDWLGLVRGMREIGFDGSLIMDFGTTAAAFSPLLRPQLLPLAKAVADYFGWQISMKNVLKKYNERVLFGAGNMCRNYMKCYGEEFPPLFTCDNNRTRWGERFEGLEIKPPESLKGLDPGCAIFICNVYYKEIEKQLREMDIPNPIEYFNDEYMPSYYFDTLEYWEGEA